MKYTLLEMTQLILSSMDGDEINSIGDTTESRQIVDIIQVTYNDLCSTMDFPEQYDFFELTGADVSTPVMLTIPEHVVEYDYLTYDTQLDTDTARKFDNVYRLPYNEFLARMNSLDPSDADTETFTYTGSNGVTVDFYYKNNAMPLYYAVIADRVLVFDGYDKSQNLSLVGSKFQGYGKINSAFQRNDSWVAPFDKQTFSLFFNEAKSQASLELRQVQNSKADQRARQAKLRTQNNKDRDDNDFYYDRLPNFARRRGGRSVLSAIPKARRGW